MNEIARRIVLGLFGHRAPSGSGVLAVEEIVPLDPRRRLCLVRCRDQRALVLTGGANDVLLGWLPPEPARANPP